MLNTVKTCKKEVFEYLIVLAFVYGLGTGFYSNVEGFRPLDSLYLSVITTATVGYGDIAPHTDAGKTFTMFYLVGGWIIHISFARVMVAKQRRQEGDH